MYSFCEVYKIYDATVKDLFLSSCFLFIDQDSFSSDVHVCVHATVFDVGFCVWVCVCVCVFVCACVFVWKI